MLLIILLIPRTFIGRWSWFAIGCVQYQHVSCAQPLIYPHLTVTIWHLSYSHSTGRNVIHHDSYSFLFILNRVAVNIVRNDVSISIFKYFNHPPSNRDKTSLKRSPWGIRYNVSRCFSAAMRTESGNFKPTMGASRLAQHGLDEIAILTRSANQSKVCAA